MEDTVHQELTLIMERRADLVNQLKAAAHGHDFDSPEYKALIGANPGLHSHVDGIADEIASQNREIRRILAQAITAEMDDLLKDQKLPDGWQSQVDNKLDFSGWMDTVRLVHEVMPSENYHKK